MPPPSAMCRARHKMLIGTHRLSLSALAIQREAKFLLGDIGAYRYQRRSNSVSFDVCRATAKNLPAQLENIADITYYRSCRK
jgi:hypothetical protein